MNVVRQVCAGAARGARQSCASSSSSVSFVQRRGVTTRGAGISKAEPDLVPLSTILPGLAVGFAATAVLYYAIREMKVLGGTVSPTLNANWRTATLRMNANKVR